MQIDRLGAVDLDPTGSLLVWVNITNVNRIETVGRRRNPLDGQAIFLPATDAGDHLPGGSSREIFGRCGAAQAVGNILAFISHVSVETGNRRLIRLRLLLWRPGCHSVPAAVVIQLDISDLPFLVVGPNSARRGGKGGFAHLVDD